MGVAVSGLTAAGALLMVRAGLTSVPLRTPRLTSTLVAFLPVACGGSTAGAPSDVPVARRDSASVEIVESYAPVWQDGEGLTIDPEPLLDLTTSGTAPQHEFFRVAHAARRRDGSIVVADGGASEVRVFADDGSFLWAVGRSGDGPGEFRRLRRVAPYTADSVFVFDDLLGRVTILSPAGNVGRVIPSRETLFLDLQPLDDGFLLGTRATARQPRAV